MLRRRKATKDERAAGLTEIVENHATMVSANALNPSGKMLAKAIERAMVGAVERCTADGIGDPDKIRAAMQVARATVKSTWPTMTEQERREAAGG